ncbi:hypothetical protein BKA93DRAFT_516559 [Sparassis latifolia]
MSGFTPSEFSSSAFRYWKKPKRRFLFHLSPNTCNGGEASNQRTPAKAVRVCKAFHGPALDGLWENLKRVSGLCSCSFSAFKTVEEVYPSKFYDYDDKFETHVIDGEITPAEWARTTLFGYGKSLTMMAFPSCWPRWRRITRTSPSYCSSDNFNGSSTSLIRTSCT